MIAAEEIKNKALSFIAVPVKDITVMPDDSFFQITIVFKKKVKKIDFYRIKARMVHAFENDFLSINYNDGKKMFVYVKNN